MNTSSTREAALPASWLNPLAGPAAATHPRGMSERPAPADATPAAPEDLIERSRRGSREAFGELVRQFEGRIFHYLAQLTGNAHDAQDLTQDTFVKAWRGIGRFESSGSFTSWLFIIARRTALNHFRSRRHESNAEAPEEIDETTPARVFEESEERASLWSLARRLKPAQYEALWLRYGEGFSVEEAARVMRTNPLRVRVLLHRGRAALGRLLEQRATREKTGQ